MHIRLMNEKKLYLLSCEIYNQEEKKLNLN